MAVYCIIKDGVVVNVTEWDGITPYSPSEDFDYFIASSGGAGIGWTYSDGAFTPPAPPPE
jgi:hypothetical protein